LRLYGEPLSKYVLTYEGVNPPYQSQKERLDYLLKEGTIPIEVYEMLDALRIKGNKAVHEANYGSLIEGKTLLKIAFFLGVWLKQLYGQWDFELPEYQETDEPLLKLT
jgi:type I restriction enzyme, R subunit